MNVVMRQDMSLEEFLAWEEQQELRWEYDGSQTVAMVGGTQAHAIIQGNIVTALNVRLRGTPCRAVGSDLKVQTSSGARYPDAFVFCNPGPGSTTIINDPVVIFEVISPSTGGTDRFDKNREYAAIPSVRRYVMLEQEGIAATMFERDGSDWVGRILSAGDMLRMPEIGIEVPLAEFYEGV